MVDEEQFRRTTEQVVTLPCPFEKAIVSRVCGCREARKTNIGEREAMNCGDEEAQLQCVELLTQIRRRANFALGLTHMPSALPHAKAVKLQCGGLLGLQHALDGGDQPDRVSDIRGLVKRALKRCGALEKMPFEQLVRTMAQYDHRQRGRRRNKA